jgi:hypothetical protein
MLIKAKLSKDPTKNATVEFDLQEDLDWLTGKFGKEVIASNAVDSIVISIQALVRRMLEKGKSQGEIQAAVSDYQPKVGTRGPAKSAFERVTENLGKLSAEERAALIAQLRQAA